MEHPPQKWTLPDLVDFEVLLREREDAEASGREREAVDRVLVGSPDRSRGEAVRRGLRAWLEVRRVERGELSGERVALALRFTAFIAAVLGFLAGTSIMRGMLQLGVDGERTYHLWVFLAVTIALQWLVLLFSVGTYLFMRGKGRRTTVAGEMLGGLARRLVRGKDPEVWAHLWSPLSGSSPVIAWRLTSLSQGMGVAFNAGLIMGFLGCLWFFDVRFDLESTFASLAYDQWFKVADFLSLPWSWSGIAAAPTKIQLEEYSIISGNFSFTDAGRTQCIGFLFMALAVWGLFPRVLLWFVARRGEARALASLNFQERRHRVLWRQLVRQEDEKGFSGPGDGVVVINVGGIDLDEEEFGSFLLRGLRLHADAVFNAEVLNGSREEDAFEAIRRAPLGVIILVEGWSLSPKQMGALYERIREIDSERGVRFLVLGEIEGGRPAVPSAEDLSQWQKFGDSLRDPAVIVTPFKPVIRVEAES